MGKIKKDCKHCRYKSNVYAYICNYYDSYVGNICSGCIAYEKQISSEPKPRHIADIERCLEILQAMQWKTQQGIKIPKAWLEELNEKLNVE